MIRQLFAVLLLSAVAIGARPTLSALSVKAGPRGLALVLDVGTPGGETFSCTVSPRSTGSMVHISATGIAWGLDQREFLTFAPTAPLTSVKAVAAGPSFALDISVRSKLSPTDLRVKHIGNKVAFLLTSAPCTEYGWNVSGSTAPVMAS